MAMLLCSAFLDLPLHWPIRRHRHAYLTRPLFKITASTHISPAEDTPVFKKKPIDMSLINFEVECLLCDIPLRLRKKFLCSSCEQRKNPYQQAIRRLIARYNRLVKEEYRQCSTIAEHVSTIKELREKIASLEEALTNSQKSDDGQEGKTSDMKDQEGQGGRASDEANGNAKQDTAEQISSDKESVPLEELKQPVTSVVFNVETEKVLSDEQRVLLEVLKKTATSVVSDVETAFLAAQDAIAKANAKHDAALQVLLCSIQDVASIKKQTEEAFSTLSIDKATKANEHRASPETN